MDQTPEEFEKFCRQQANKIWLHIFGIKRIEEEETPEQKRNRELNEKNYKDRADPNYENKMDW